MKRGDVPDEHAIELAAAHRADHARPGVIDALVSEGVPEKVALAKVLHLADRGLLEYGTSPYHAWPTQRGEQA